MSRPVTNAKQSMSHFKEATCTLLNYYWKNSSRKFKIGQMTMLVFGEIMTF